MSRISSPRLVGRAQELARLEAALASGQPRTLLVGGEAGIGKTRLLAEFSAHARAAGARVLIGACLPLGQGALAFAPISQALRQLVRELDPATLEQLVGAWRGELARLVPDLAQQAPSAPTTGGLARGRLFAALLGVLERLAAAGPLVLAIEDLHWADRSTLDLLGYLAANLTEPAVVLVGTYRSDEPDPSRRLRRLLAELDRRPQVERVELGRLDRTDLAGLLTGIVGAPPAPRVLDEVLARSDGNPFFAEELLAAGPTGGPLGLSATLHDLLAGRVEGLSDPAQQVLGVAAVAGRRVSHGLLAAACPLEEQALLAALREAVEHQVLVADRAGDAYWFRHALLQEVVELELLPGERSRLHAVLARCLSDRPELAGGTPAQLAAEVAVHWEQGHDLARALPAVVAAGRAAEQGLAFAEAQWHFERALELWDQVPEIAAGLPLDRTELLERAAQAAHWAGGDQRRAVALARAALASVDATAEPVRAGLLAERLGWYLWLSDSDAALGAYQQALDLVPAEPPTAARARVLAGQAHALMMTSRLREALVGAEEALAVARRCGARREEGWALLALGSAMDRVEPETPLALLREARKIAEELGEIELLAETFVYLPQIHLTAGRLVDALADVLEGMETARRLGLERTSMLLGAMAGDLCFQLGRWQDADRYGRRAVAATPMPTMPALHARMWRAEFEIERGEFAAAARRLDDLRQAVSDPPWPQFTDHFEARAALAIWQGRLDDARAAVQQGLHWLAGAEEEELYLRTLLTLGLRAEADRAERADARRIPTEAQDARQMGAALLARLRQLADQASEPETIAHAALGEAEATRLQGHPDPDRWAAAAARWEELDQPYRAAYAHWRQAEALLGGRGARAEAATALRSAHQTAQRLGAAPLRGELEALARRARIDLAEPPPAGQPAPARPAEPFGLTAREREVLTLLAEGRTNPQIAQALFISTKTASTHVSNILAKLGVTSRVEAAAVAHRGELLDQP